MNPSEAVRPRRGPPTAANPEVRLVIGGRQRAEGRLDVAVDDPPDDPPLADVVEVAGRGGHGQSALEGFGAKMRMPTRRRPVATAARLTHKV